MKNSGENLKRIWFTETLPWPISKWDENTWNSFTKKFISFWMRRWVKNRVYTHTRFFKCFKINTAIHKTLRIKFFRVFIKIWKFRNDSIRFVLVNWLIIFVNQFTRMAMIRIYGQYNFNALLNVMAFAIKIGQLNVLRASLPQGKWERWYANGFCLLKDFFGINFVAS